MEWQSYRLSGSSAIASSSYLRSFQLTCPKVYLSVMLIAANTASLASLALRAHSYSRLLLCAAFKPRRINYKEHMWTCHTRLARL